MLVFTVFLYFLIDFANCEKPRSLCTPDFPFLAPDLGCDSFQSVCYKKGDKQCNLLQKACEQCPPSQFTAIMLKNVTHRVAEIEAQSKRLQTMMTNRTDWNENKITKIIEVTNASRVIVIMNVVIIILICLFLCILYLKRNSRISRQTEVNNIFKQKYRVNRRNTSLEDIHEKIQLLKDKLRISDDIHEEIMKGILLKNKLLISDDIHEEIMKGILLKNKLLISDDICEEITTGKLPKDKLLESDEMLVHIMKKLDDLTMMFLITSTGGYQINSDSLSNDIKFATIQFQFDDVNQEPIDLYVHNNHNIVQVKQQICAKLPHAKHDDYKIMKLKYNGIILNDDNQYLLEKICRSNTIVNCFIDSSMNASDIVVVKLQGKMRLPDIIQINKNQTVDQLKEYIEKIINSKDFSIFKNSNESTKTENLKDNLNDLKDGDWIKIVTKESGRLIIRSIFDDEDSITIEYVNVDLVSSLMTSISNKFNWNLNNFVLFYNNKYLRADKYIFEYQISSESAVKYCFFMKWAGINMNDDYITKGNFSELRRGTFRNTNTEILIRKYEVKSSKTWKDEEFMLKELITFQMTKSHRRFIQLLGVYIDDAILYVVMENMDRGTLKTFLQENYKNLDKNKIYKWSAQILEGLKFLHENKVIHRDLNPSSILVDGNEDLKLSSFNLSKYLDISKAPASIMGKHDKKKELPLRYMAPEILNSDNYGEACDVWSFGAVLIRITTNKKPYSNLNKSEALDHISKLKMIEYKLPNKYSEFKSIINLCLQQDPSWRGKVKELIEKINNVLK